MLRSVSSTSENPRHGTSIAWAAALSVLLCGGSHLAFGRDGLNLREEGYLWYGVLRVLEGEVPLRDFQGYDPGRYYWCAAFTWLFGQGILGVRAAATAFQALGFFFGSLALARLSKSRMTLLVSAVIVFLWMFPRFKLFEHSIALGAVWMGARYLEAPGRKCAFCSGAFVGLAAFFGRNHGVYLALAFSALLLFEGWKTRSPGLFRRLLALAAGVLVGYAPAWGMLLFVPGYADAVLQAVSLDLAHGANTPEPYPWFWRVPHGGLDLFELAVQLALDAAFLLPVILFPLGILVALRTRSDQLAARALPIAATTVGLLYVHHYAVRSDLPHFAQASPPLWLLALGIPALLPGMRRLGTWFVLGLLLIPSLLVTGRGTLFSADPQFPLVHEKVEYPVAGEPLWLFLPKARQLHLLKRAVDYHVAAEEEDLFIVPASPTLYPFLGKRSPTWWILFIWHATAAEQAATIRQLEEREVKWILLCLQDYDHDPAYRFELTNPDVLRYIAEHFVEVGKPVPPTDYRLLRRR